MSLTFKYFASHEAVKSLLHYKKIKFKKFRFYEYCYLLDYPSWDIHQKPFYFPIALHNFGFLYVLKPNDVQYCNFMIIKNKCFKVITNTQYLELLYIGTYSKKKNTVFIDDILYKLNWELETLEPL